MTCDEALTDAVAVVLAEDEALTEARDQLVARSRVAAQQWSRDTGIPASDDVRALVLSTALRDWCEELAQPGALTAMGHALIGTALACVDWLGLARRYLREDEP